MINGNVKTSEKCWKVRWEMRYLIAWLAGCFEATRKPTVKLFSHGALLQACRSFTPQFTYIKNNVAGPRIWLSGGAFA